jgi:hypothetical protein
VLSQAPDQAAAGVGDDELDTLQASILEMVEKGAPAGLVLLGAIADAQDRPETFLVDTDGDQTSTESCRTSPAQARLSTRPSRYT